MRGDGRHRAGAIAQRAPDAPLALEEAGAVGQVPQPGLGAREAATAQGAVGEPDEQRAIAIGELRFGVRALGHPASSAEASCSRARKRRLMIVPVAC